MASIDQSTWMARATGYELLSLAFLLPRESTGEALVSGEFAEAVDEVLSALDADEAARGEVSKGLSGYAGADAKETFHEIRREYTRLFVGEREPLVTPYAGVRAAQEKGQRGLLFVGEESVTVEHFMKRCGLRKDLESGHANDPLDHVGTMCEFMKYLCLIAAKAIAAPGSARIEPGDYEAFRAAHFVPYARWCAAQVEELSRIPFYRSMARLLAFMMSQAEADCDSGADAASAVPSE